MPKTRKCRQLSRTACFDDKRCRYLCTRNGGECLPAGEMLQRVIDDVSEQDIPTQEENWFPFFPNFQQKAGRDMPFFTDYSQEWPPQSESSWEPPEDEPPPPPPKKTKTSKRKSAPSTKHKAKSEPHPAKPVKIHPDLWYCVKPYDRAEEENSVRIKSCAKGVQPIKSHSHLPGKSRQECVRTCYWE